VQLALQRLDQIAESRFAPRVRCRPHAGGHDPRWSQPGIGLLTLAFQRLNRSAGPLAASRDSSGRFVGSPRPGSGPAPSRYRPRPATVALDHGGGAHHRRRVPHRVVKGLWDGPDTG
jgi:hypothetical protein